MLPVAGLQTCPGAYSGMHPLSQHKFLSAVASACSVSTTALEMANPQISDPNVVSPGMPICVPPDCCSILPCLGLQATGPAPAPLLNDFTAVATGVLIPAYLTCVEKACTCNTGAIVGHGHN